MQRRPWDIDTGKKDLVASNYIPSMIQAGTAIKTESDFVLNNSRCIAMATADEHGKVIPNGPGAHVMITEPNTLMRMSSNNFIASPKGKGTFEFQGQMHNGRSIKVGEGNTFVVVESTGGGKGLVSSRYRILSVDEKTGLFHVQRGCSTGTLKVRMAAIAA